MGASGEVHPRGPTTVAGDARDLRAAVEVHPVVGVDLPVQLTHLGPQHALQRVGPEPDHRDVQAERAGGRRDLQPDPAVADDRQPPDAVVPVRAQRRGQGVAAVERP